MQRMDSVRFCLRPKSFGVSRGAGGMSSSQSVLRAVSRKSVRAHTGPRRVAAGGMGQDRLDLRVGFWRALRFAPQPLAQLVQLAGVLHLFSHAEHAFLLRKSDARTIPVFRPNCFLAVTESISMVGAVL
jgi:hypothetical protein